MGTRIGRYIAIVGLSALVAVTAYTELTRHGSVAGLQAGTAVPPFAAPLAVDGPVGDVNVATRPDQGQAGRRPACEVTGAGILNICQLYRRAPVVLALFIDSGSCTRVLRQLEQLAGAFPQVRFAAVAIKGEAHALARLVRSRRLTVPVAVDRDGILAGLYRMISCPQLTFVYPGGRTQGEPLIDEHALPAVRARVQELVANTRTRGWTPSRA